MATEARPPVALPADQLRLGMRLPFTLLDEAGRVLLAKGLCIEDEQQLELLRARERIFVPFEESELAIKVLMTGLLELDRHGAALKDLDRYLSRQDEGDAPEGAAVLRGTMPQQCAEVAARLRRLLVALAQRALAADEAQARLQGLWAELQQWAAARVTLEAATLVLTYRACSSPAEYSVLHALQCAVLAQRVAPLLRVPAAEVRPLVMACATMNVAMVQLQDVLARQTQPVSPAQRAQIDAHAQEGERLLRAAGVSDEAWLQAVRWHHQSPPAGPLDVLPVGWRLASIVQGLDRYTAAMSPRASRPGRSARDAARTVIARQGAGAQDPLGVALVQVLGLYPPGTFVRLHAGELGLVLRPGQRATTPVAAVVVNRHGEPLGTPKLVDCARPEHAVAESVPGSAVKARIDLEEMVERLMYSRTPGSGLPQ